MICKYGDGIIYLKYQVLIINVVKFKRKLINIKSGYCVGMRDASGRRRPAQDQAFIAKRRVHSPGTTLARSRTPSRRRHGGGGSWWACRPDMFGLGGGSSRCSLLSSRALRVVRVARALVSGHTRPDRA